MRELVMKFDGEILMLIKAEDGKVLPRYRNEIIYPGSCYV